MTKKTKPAKNAEPTSRTTTPVRTVDLITPAKLNELHQQFWEDQSRKTEELLAKRAVAAAVNIELEEATKSVRLSVDEADRRERIRHMRSLEQTAQIEARKLAAIQSAIAQAKRPKARATHRSVVTAAMKRARANGDTFEAFLASAGSASIPGILIAKADSAVERFDVDCDDVPAEKRYSRTTLGNWWTDAGRAEA